jgi:hypothetical protein
MHITSIEAPINGGTLMALNAVSTRGRRYMCSATSNGQACGVFRESPRDTLPGGRTFWKQVTAPTALKSAVRQAIRQSRH